MSEKTKKVKLDTNQVQDKLTNQDHQENDENNDLASEKRVILITVDPHLIHRSRQQRDPASPRFAAFYHPHGSP